MTEIAAHGSFGCMSRRVPAPIARLQRQLPDRLHADGDAFACEHEWISTPTTGRLGFGSPVHRDMGFEQPAVATRCDQEYTGWRTDARSG